MKYLVYLLPFLFYQCSSPEQTQSTKSHSPSKTTQVIQHQKSLLSLKVDTSLELKESSFEVTERDSLDYYQEDYSHTKRAPIDSSKFNISLQPTKPYSQVLKQIEVKRTYFQTLYLNTESDSIKARITNLAKVFLEDAIINKIIPHWYGTEWDFGGHTATPKEGTIACGYFTSTVLNHAGFNLNRFRFGQQASLIGARSLQTDKPILNYSGTPIQQIVDLLVKKNEEGLYKVGLDIHTGFILIRNKKVFFIHSNYINSEGVVIEYAKESEALLRNNTFVLAEITVNDHLMTRWIKGEEIKIRKQ